MALVCKNCSRLNANFQFSGGEHHMVQQSVPKIYITQVLGHIDPCGHLDVGVFCNLSGSQLHRG